MDPGGPGGSILCCVQSKYNVQVSCEKCKEWSSSWKNTAPRPTLQKCTNVQLNLHAHGVMVRSALGYVVAKHRKHRFEMICISCVAII